MHECFQKHFRMGTARMKQDEREGKKRCVSMERSKAGTKKWSPKGLIIIIIIIKKDWQYKAGRGRLTPYQSEDPSPTLPTYRGKEEKGKIVEDKKGESN